MAHSSRRFFQHLSRKFPQSVSVGPTPNGVSMRAGESVRDYTKDGDSETSGSIERRTLLMLNSELFSGMTPQLCSDFAAVAAIRTFARGELIFLQGHKRRFVSLIEAGIIKLSQLSSDGNEAVLWVNGEGEAMGATSASGGLTHTCTAQVIDDCSLLSWECRVFQRLAEVYPQVNKNVNLVIASRTSELEKRYREVATEGVTSRLARTLLRLMKTIGKRDCDGIYVALSRTDLAKMTGMSPFTLSRVISEWNNQGLVIPLREALVVRFPNRLERLCN